MLFFMAFMMLFFGLTMAGIFSLLPVSMTLGIPLYLKMMFFVVGMIISFIGVFLIFIRADKTGAKHLLETGRPDKILWFYVHRDGTIKITPAVREVEGQLYSPELDAQIQDMRSYRLFDHSVRIVPEGIAHAINLDMCLYAQFLKTKYGYENLREARQSLLEKLFPPKPKTSQELMEPKLHDEIKRPSQ